MKDEEGKRCPFVRSEGCAVYEDRPGACRIYPIGRAAMNRETRGHPGEIFCRPRRALSWIPRASRLDDRRVVADQGLKKYDGMNSAWLDIVTSPQSLGPEKDVPRKNPDVLHGLLHLDPFRSFVFKSRFLDLFDVSPELRDRLASDDEALLTFAMDWLKFSLYGMQTMKLK